MVQRSGLVWVSSFFAFAGFVLALAMVPSCTAAGKLPPCARPSDKRMWCRCEVAQTTVERATAGLPVACTIPFVASACVDKDPSGGMMEFLSGLEKFRNNYTAPGGWPPYVEVDGKAYWLRCPAQTEKGYADCVTNGQPTNPWPGYPVADLDQGAPTILPGLKPQSGGGGSAGVGGASEGGDCAICLAAAPCDGLTPMECTTMHCAAVCPWDDTMTTCGSVESPIGGGGPDCVGSGGACGVDASCCPGLYCYASDVGTSCM